MRACVKALALETKGFLSEAEGLRLFELAVESSTVAPCLEIGSYCGKSTIFLAEGCRVGGKHPLFAVDHHRGSEEQQSGQPYFDPDLYDEEEGVVSTLSHLMCNIRKAGLLDWVIPVVADSYTFGRYWSTAMLSLVFIDGNHAAEDVFLDFFTWGVHIVRGGYLCIHDIFPDPAEGGQAPYHVSEFARATGRWAWTEQVETLGILKRR